ncbi:unnamed protein product [Ceutorhynchus assimilis]|uniref:Innexin n=1 Tax=Ceutorhynchus assimilis TaxID=467358 RepID=A0A9N9QS72_9CUCU|nr:unnamed protein product [Ceutorhynchus assimilis]
MDFLNDFKTLAKGDKIRTDNNIFKLHYKFSVLLLIAFSVLLSSKQYFGDPINCDVEAHKETVEVFCWVTGTFVIEDNTPEENFIYGLGNEAGKRTYTLLFYQWICLLFFLQALLFYMPRYLWKTWEGNRLGEVVDGLGGPLISEKWSPDRKEQIKRFILNQENHDIFAYRFAICEVLNLCNLIIQVYIMDWYLEGRFSLYGYDVVTKPWPQTYNAVFPKRTKCTYHKFGQSGSFVNRDALCVLPLNVLNEKFFLILWFWIAGLFLLTIAALIYRAMIICWVHFRLYILIAQARTFNRKKLRIIVWNISHGQFFLLYNVGKNMNPLIFKEFLNFVFHQLEIKGDDFSNL